MLEPILSMSAQGGRGYFTSSQHHITIVATHSATAIVPHVDNPYTIKGERQLIAYHSNKMPLSTRPCCSSMSENSALQFLETLGCENITPLGVHVAYHGANTISAKGSDRMAYSVAIFRHGWGKWARIKPKSDLRI